MLGHCSRQLVLNSAYTIETEEIRLMKELGPSFTWPEDVFVPADGGYLCGGTYEQTVSVPQTIEGIDIGSQVTSSQKGRWTIGQNSQVMITESVGLSFKIDTLWSSEFLELVITPISIDEMTISIA